MQTTTSERMTPHTLESTDYQSIPFLIPDMPSLRALKPYLEAIEENHIYSNFGPLVRLLEAKLTEYLSTFSSTQNFVATCATGTDAIELALRSLHLPKNAKVLVPAYTFIATGLAILRAGLQPVFADVDSLSWNLTPEIATGLLSEIEFDAVLPVASYGFPQDVDAWDVFTEETGLPVVIDAAGAFGHQTLGKTTTVIFSLHATKLFGAGEGGLICSPNPETIACTHSLSQFGRSHHGVSELGTNSKLSEYHAAVALAQLDRWPLKYARHLGLKQEFLSLLKSYHLLSWQPETHHYATSMIAIKIGHQKASTMANSLSHYGIEARQYYTPMLCDEPLFSDYQTTHLTQSRQLQNSVICLPFHHQLTEESMRFILAALKSPASNDEAKWAPHK